MHEYRPLNCKSTHKNKSLGYLSGSLRVSTRPEASAAGPRAHTLGVISAFRTLGWEVKPFIVGDRVLKRWITSEFSMQNVGFVKKLAIDLARFGLGLYYSQRALREVLGVDLVYERYGVFQAMGYWFQRKGIPWILETNELYYVNAIDDRKVSALKNLIKAHERWAYKKCDVLVCISKTLADMITQDLKITRNKIVVLPNGVDPNLFNPEKVVACRIFKEPTIGFIGGELYPWYKLDLLLEAIADLRKDMINYCLVVIGDGIMRRNWENLALKLNLKNYVRFLGRIRWEEIPQYIAGFDLGYFGAVPRSSGIDGSPLKLYEYASMAKPVIAGLCSDVIELLEGGGIYPFHPGNYADLKRALREAYNNRSKWSDQGKRNRTVIITKHSWETRVCNLIDQINEILNRQIGT